MRRFQTRCRRRSAWSGSRRARTRCSAMGRARVGTASRQRIPRSLATPTARSPCGSRPSASSPTAAAASRASSHRSRDRLGWRCDRVHDRADAAVMTSPTAMPAWDANSETWSVRYNATAHNWTAWYLGYSAEGFVGAALGQMQSLDADGTTWTRPAAPIYQPTANGWDSALISARLGSRVPMASIGFTTRASARAAPASAC